jgi:hypothetical protein
MKKSNWIVLGALGIGAYLLYKYSKSSLGSDSGSFGGATYPAVPIPLEYQGDTSLRSTPAQEQQMQTYLDTAARQGQTVLFKDTSGKVVGVQDATLGMSYRIEANPEQLLKASSSSLKQTTAQARVSIAGTPYSTTSSSVAANLNNALSTAAASLKSSSSATVSNSNKADTSIANISKTPVGGTYISGGKTMTIISKSKK